LFATAGHHTVFRLRADAPPDLLLSDQFEAHFVELPKFRLSAEELRTPLDRWCYLLRYAADFDPAALPEPMKDETIREAVTVLEELSMTQAERWAYEDRIKGQRDQWARDQWVANREATIAQMEASVAQKQAHVAQQEHLLNVREKRAMLREAVLDKFQSQSPSLTRRLTALEDLDLLGRLTAKLGESATAADFAAALDAEPLVPSR
jgi:hypothetical protein